MTDSSVVAAAICPACRAPDVTVAPEWPLAGGARALQCRDCGLLFADPQPPADVLAAYYAQEGDWQASRDPAWTAKAQTRTKRAAGDLFVELDRYFAASAPPPGAGVLDFGCGSGTWLNSFQDRGWQTAGIEMSTDAAFARHRRLTAVPTSPTFDLVLVYHVLEHLPRPLESLTELAGALVPGGHCLVSVPRVDTIAEHGDRKYCLNPPRHIVAFTEACLRGLLARAGLTPLAALHQLDKAFTKGRPLRLRLLARKPI